MCCDFDVTTSAVAVSLSASLTGFVYVSVLNVRVYVRTVFNLSRLTLVPDPINKDSHMGIYPLTHKHLYNTHTGTHKHENLARDRTPVIPMRV